MFKNLMLVAVAAMAFTACQKDNGELDAPKRIVNFTANIGGDDTRSGFTGKEGDAYKSAWDGGEMLFVKAENTEKWPTIDAEGKFTVEFSADDQSATFYSPVASWEYNTSYNTYMPVVPATQTPRANSVDPTAHILQAQDVLISGSENVNVTFEHAVAYGKMAVNTTAGFDISKVVINLVGADNGVEKDLTYTINADKVENNVFWFATEALKVSEMTVTAYGKEGETDKIYSKTVTVDEGKLEFAYGRVGSFSVSNLGEYVKPAAPAFTSASADGTYGDRYVTFTSQELGKLILNTYNCFQNSMWPAGTYTFGNTSNHIYPGSYSTYNNTSLYSGEVLVSIVNGLYHVEFFNLADYSSNIVLEHATYTGTISPLEIPDSRQALSTPVVVSSISGKTITLSWEAIENAEGYYIECTSSNDIEPISTTETTATITVPSYSYYSFSVQAVVSADNTTYRSSEKAYAEYNDPRTALGMPIVEASISGKTITLSWEAIENAESYYIECMSSYDIEPISTTETTVTITVPSYSYYSFSVRAVVSEDNATYRSSDAAYVEYNDPRTVLPSPSNVTATIDGAYAKISWDPVEGADGYKLSYYLNGNNEVTVEEPSYTMHVGFNVSDLWVYVFSIVEDDNQYYRSSESWNSYVVVNTGSDPSIIPVVFTSCTLNQYVSSQWRVSFNFSDSVNNSMTLWLTTDHGAKDTSLGYSTKYNSFTSYASGVGNYYCFCPQNVIVNGETKTANGGFVDIVNNDNGTWDVEMVITFNDGTTQTYKYSGGIS